MTNNPTRDQAQMWGGRFTRPPDPEFQRFNASFSFDYRLLEEDIQVNLAWSEALQRAGVLQTAEQERLAEALRQIRTEFSGSGPIEFPAEDIHSFVEAQLVSRCGDLGYKIHTGRSRNDQVATDIRLFLKKAVLAVRQDLAAMVAELLALAGRHPGVPMAGYTHLQRAQPILFAHYLLSFEAMAERDDVRLRAAFDAADELPLGSGALAGTAFAVDRRALARALGFARVSANSVDSVSNRDFLCDFLYAGTLLMAHLSRLAADFILYTTTEFDLLRMDETVTTGSSLMPQKRNPDAMELVRGKAATMEARLMGLISLLRGLPSSYNKDLQEDKPPIFAALEELRLTLQITRTALQGTQINESAMHRAASDSFLLATDLADYLVLRGVPFRKAHHLVGQLVTRALAGGRQLTDLTLQELQAEDGHFEADIGQFLTLENSLARRDRVGGTSPERVSEALREALARWNARTVPAGA